MLEVHFFLTENHQGIGIVARQMFGYMAIGLIEINTVNVQMTTYAKICTSSKIIIDLHPRVSPLPRARCRGSGGLSPHSQKPCAKIRTCLGARTLTKPKYFRISSHSGVR